MKQSSLVQRIRAITAVTLLATLSYEGFYSTIIPGLFKVGVTAVVGIVIVTLIAKRSGRNAALPA